MNEPYTLIRINRTTHTNTRCQVLGEGEWVRFPEDAYDKSELIFMGEDSFWSYYMKKHA